MPTYGINDFLNAALCTIDGEELIDLSSVSSDMKIEVSKTEYSNLNFRKQLGYNFDLDITDIDSKVLDELTARNKPMRIVDYKLIQNKRHKKKRINKKWAKKYGHTMEVYVDRV